MIDKQKEQYLLDNPEIKELFLTDPIINSAFHLDLELYKVLKLCITELSKAHKNVSNRFLECNLKCNKQKEVNHEQ